jgi:hypothetical protein
MATQRRRLRQRGIALMFYATMLIFVVGCVGLAVDVGTIYMIKARLSAAVDAAALAGGRSVNFANDVTTATNNFTTTANQYFAANFPTGYFNSIGTPTVTPSFSQETDANGNVSGVLDFKVTATVSAPTYFMNIFHFSNVTVGATGTASRRGLVLMLVLDISSSMGNGAGSPCEVMKAAAENFTTLFSPFDQLGLVTFDYTAHLKDSPTTNHTQISNDIAAIQQCQNNTNTTSALEIAYQQIRNTNLPLALNTIVLFTDGSPNGVTANFPARTLVDNRWGPALANPPVPAQSGITYGHANGIDSNGNPTCGDVGPSDPNQALTTAGASVNEEAICVNMPVIASCAATDTLYGTLVQWGDQSSWGGTTRGLYDPTDTNAHSYPASCDPGGQTANIRQYIAGIPQYDIYGNDLYNGCGSAASCPAATGASPNGTIVGGFDTRRNWLFQMNWTCTTAPITPNCRNVGGTWANNGGNGGVGSGNNFFPPGSAYPNLMRPDQPNTVVAASMNGAMSEAYRIRSDAVYNPVIHTIYLVGNRTDAADREFLAIIANAQNITALPYDAGYLPPPNDPALYANPVYKTNQQTGQYLVTADRNTLTNFFAQLASQVLRLSH